MQLKADKEGKIGPRMQYQEHASCQGRAGLVCVRAGLVHVKARLDWVLLRTEQGAHAPMDKAFAVQGLQGFSHAEEAVLHIVPAFLPAPTIRQPVLQQAQ